MVDFLVDDFSAVHGGREKTSFSPDVFEALKAYPWPLNFDELEKEILRLLEAGLKTVRCENLAMEISSFWIGQRGDPEVRKVIEELDGYIREFKVLGRLSAGLGEDVSGLDPWALLPSRPQRDFIGEP
jgi:DNA-binding NtrC family response regulator